VTADRAIHPTAVVDPKAELGAGVTVGAYSVVGPEVVLADGVEVGHHAVLEGRVIGGAGVKIGHGSVVGGPPQDLKYRDGTPSGVRIGRGTTLREYVTVHRSTRPEAWTVIGEDCLLMSMSHVAHDCRLGDGVVVINYAGITGHCEIDERATVGGLTGIHPFTRVGAFAYIGGCSKIVSDVPPYVIVDGAPATARGINVIGLRRAGVGAEDRRLLRQAFRMLYRSGLAPGRALERIRDELPASPHIVRLTEFIAASRRGICGAPRPGAGDPTLDDEHERVF
jgi:UDP-N-acetylglucosamine acyltransferase